MKRTDTRVSGVFVIEPVVFSDDRGAFFESYNQDAFRELGIEHAFVQDNHSVSRRGVLRGLHFQFPPKPMAKLVRCARGRIFDVAVDMRKESPTFRQWVGAELSAENRKMLHVPAGCAHGFYALEDCEVLYKCSATYDASLDGNFRYDDPEIGVAWPIDGDVLLSVRDQNAPSFLEVVDRANAI